VLGVGLGHSALRREGRFTEGASAFEMALCLRSDEEGGKGARQVWSKRIFQGASGSVTNLSKKEKKKEEKQKTKPWKENPERRKRKSVIISATSNAVVVYLLAAFDPGKEGSRQQNAQGKYVSSTKKGSREGGGEETAT